MLLNRLVADAQLRYAAHAVPPGVMYPLLQFRHGLLCINQRLIVSAGALIAGPLSRMKSTTLPHKVM